MFVALTCFEGLSKTDSTHNVRSRESWLSSICHGNPWQVLKWIDIHPCRDLEIMWNSHIVEAKSLVK